MNYMSYEQIARDIRQEREAEAAKWRLADELPRHSASPDTSMYQRLMAALMSVLLFYRGL